MKEMALSDFSVYLALVRPAPGEQPAALLTFAESKREALDKAMPEILKQWGDAASIILVTPILTKLSIPRLLRTELCRILCAVDKTILIKCQVGDITEKMLNLLDIHRDIVETLRADCKRMIQENEENS